MTEILFVGSSRNGGRRSRDLNVKENGKKFRKNVRFKKHNLKFNFSSLKIHWKQLKFIISSKSVITVKSNFTNYSYWSVPREIIFIIFSVIFIMFTL